MTTTWNKRMKSDLAAAGYAPGTQGHYFRAARRLSERFQVSPEALGQKEIRKYFDEARKREESASWMKVEMAGVRFLYGVTLARPGEVAWLRWPRQPASLPVVLSGKQIVALLGAISSPLYRTVAMTMYGAGLRIAEACTLQVDDIDSARGLIHVRHGKGNKARAVMLGDALLQALRAYWRANRPPKPYLC